MKESIKTEHRLTYLDAIRGLAALSVVMAHVIASHWSWMKEARIAYIFINGSDAVAMFFVLSGLVLSYKVFQNKIAITAPYYKQYIIARVFRLYPAFLVMLVIYYVYEHYKDGLGHLFWETLIHNPYYFWEEALLVRDHHTLFLPDWTLGVEMAVSAFVPFMVLLTLYDRRLFIYMLLACIFAGKLYISEYFWHFGLGILIAQHFDQIYQFKDNTQWWYRYRWAFLPLIIVLYSNRHVLYFYPLSPSMRYFFDSILYVSEYLFSGLASALILMLVINSAALRRFFSFGIFDFIGKISYGVYLSHWLFTLLAMRNFEYLMPTYAQGSEMKFFILYSLFTVAASIVTATLLYYLIERPFIRLGKRVAKRG